MLDSTLISIRDCRVEDSRRMLTKRVSWEMCTGEAWLVTGPNGSGKAAFLSALAGDARFVLDADDGDAHYCSIFDGSTEIVSLEKAAEIIQKERENDDGEFLASGKGGGRTGRVFLAEAIVGARVPSGATSRAERQNIIDTIGARPELRLCGVEHILERKLKNMSTGEIRRILLARALLSGKQLLILSEPFAGLDGESRAALYDFFNNIAKRQLVAQTDGIVSPRIILGMERYYEIPASITHVAEFCDGAISFCGAKSEYELLLVSRKEKYAEERAREKSAFTAEINKLQNAPRGFASPLEAAPAFAGLLRGRNEFSACGVKLARQTQSANDATKSDDDTLVEMRNVNVGWGEHKVLVDLNWTLHKGEHWLIRGPNGSGKTTFLELISGDNTQVYCNDVRVFGIKRGSGETIWDIKEKIGIVSYRIHVEYRMLRHAPLRDVLISGFKDSIGLYEKASDIEMRAAGEWLALGGFGGREDEPFSSLSYGEQRAILILRAAVKCPPLLILDEPCHALDEAARQKILDLLETIAESGNSTLLHVTHEAGEVLPCEKHILELRPGESPMYKIIVNS